MLPTPFNAAGQPSSPAILPGFGRGNPSSTRGRRFPADPPRVEEIVEVMRTAGLKPHGLRLRGLIAVLWRSGMRQGRQAA